MKLAGYDSKGGINRRSLKEALFTTLAQPDLRVVDRFLESYPPKLLLNALFSALSNPQEQVHWHGVYAFGLIVPTLADENQESGRIIMRRLLWSLNDESGGIGWGAPEAMAEIMYHIPYLRQEYLHMLISYMREDGTEPFQDGNYLELPLLQRGLLWGIGRICQGHRIEMVERRVVDDIAAYLTSPDHHVVGMAAWCLGLLGVPFDTTKISGLLHNSGEIRLFFNNVLTTVTLGELVRGCVGLEKSPAAHASVS
ncbi:MAG: hypothetical protein OEL83_12440 [Desulforhopalus sp.]|nr:hypothetical protein [Desulforhopalus sp.]